MNRIGRTLGFGAALLALGSAFAGCGGDDDGGGSRGGSYDSIISAIESPTGTVDETTAADVGVEFEKVSQVDVPGGMRRDAQTAQSADTTVSCPAGGSVNVSGAGNQSSGQARASYDNCCATAGCCLDGKADMYYSTEQGATYSYCASYDVNYSCEGTSTAVRYDGCFNATGEVVYAIEVDGNTYAVSGSYSNGSGSLKITGKNGTWTCTYSGGSGTCTGDSGSFDF